MRKPKFSLEAALSQFQDLISGASMRAAANLKHLGEVVMASVGDGSSAGIDVDQNNHDVWLRWTDVLSGLTDVGRLFVPGGVLFRLPKLNDGAHVVRGRKMRGPGASLVMPDGGDGSSATVPGWDDGTNLDANNAGIKLPEGWHIESTGDRVRLVANSGGTKCVVELQKGGSIVLTPASGQTIQLGGTAHPLPKWDTFQAALNTFFNQFSGSSAIVVTTSGIPSPALVSAAQTIQTALGNGSYNSQVAKNG